MPLEPLQALIEDVYRVQPGYAAADFLVTDKRVAAALEQTNAAREIDEKLLIAQDDDELSVALFIDSKVLDRLADDDPMAALHGGNLADFWTVLEGLSHFVYLSWNAVRDRSVSMLELELQAEVDKYVCTSLLLRRQQRAAQPGQIHDCLFNKTRLDSALNDDERARYRNANRYADKYCKRLLTRFLRRGRLRPLMRELRTFYRLPQQAKLRSIELN